MHDAWAACWRLHHHTLLGQIGAASAAWLHTKRTALHARAVVVLGAEAAELLINTRERPGLA